MAMLVLCWLGVATALPAQQPPVHYIHQGIMPPGAIGGRQLQRGGPLPGFFQPVEIKAPPGALVSLAVANRFDEAQTGSRKGGFLIGAVYRLRVTNIRLSESLEVYPTIELIDRLYAPADQQRRFAIPIDISNDDLRLAIEGKFVTRVIYLEDPRNALAARDNPQSQNYFDTTPGQDPLAVADGLGRPVAILRLGARVPDQSEMTDPSFFYGSPPFQTYSERPASPQQEVPCPPSSQQQTPCPPAVRPTTPAVHNLPKPPDLQEQPQP